MNDKVQVVVIEDNPADVFLVQKAFEEAGVECELCAFPDGEEALRFVRGEGRHSGAAVPDLILLDLNLPKVDGETILRALREQPRLDAVPVIVWSSTQSPQHKSAVEQYRVARFVTKPSGLDEFLKIGLTVKEVLAEARNQRAPRLGQHS